MADTSGYAPLRLTAELQSQINSALSQSHPLVLAVVDSRGQAHLSFRGSLQTYSDSQLGFWLRNVQGKTVESIRCNGKVALIYRSESTPLLEFHGRTRIANGAAERERVFSAVSEVERKADPERKGLTMIIDLTR